MAGATASLHGPRDLREVALAELIKILRFHPKLANLPITWRLPDGSTQFDDPPGKGQLMIRLTPEFGPTEPFAALGDGRRSVYAPVLIHVETHVPGWAFENSARVARTIEDALFPDGQPFMALRTRLEAVGVTDLFVDRPAATPQPDGVATGTIRFDIYLTQ